MIDVENNDEKIKISKCGDLYSGKNGNWRLLKEYTNKNGIKKLRLQLYKNGKNGYRGQVYILHILVAEAFLKKPDDSYVYLLHKDGDLSNNHYICI